MRCKSIRCNSTHLSASNVILSADQLFWGALDDELCMTVFSLHFLQYKWVRNDFSHQQQLDTSAWIHHAPLPRPLLRLHCPSHPQGEHTTRWQFKLSKWFFGRRNLYFQRIVYEKETGVKELMKMMGLPSWMHWVRSCCLRLLYDVCGDCTFLNLKSPLSITIIVIMILMNPISALLVHQLRIDGLPHNRHHGRLALRLIQGWLVHHQLLRYFPLIFLIFHPLTFSRFWHPPPSQGLLPQALEVPPLPE